MRGHPEIESVTLKINTMEALFFISTFLGVYFLFSIFYPKTLFFFLPERFRTRSLGVWLTILFVALAIIFVSCSPGAQATGI